MEHSHICESVSHYFNETLPETLVFILCLAAFGAYIVGLTCLLCKLFPKLDKDEHLFDKLFFGHLIGGYVIFFIYMIVKLF